MPPLSHSLARRPEFSEGAELWPAGLDRRDFLTLMGASLALAGLAGCRAGKALVPYVVQPESIVPGIPAFFATAMPVQGYARGILVESHEGRPTKIEGNPRHAESLGATDAATQASILSLYDPERSKSPLRRGQPAAWEEFAAEWRRPRAVGSVALLTEPTTSPTLLREIHRWLEARPGLRWFQHTPLGRHDFEGAQPDYDFAAADVILDLEGDFLDGHPAALRYTRAFAGRRRVENSTARASRIYSLESAWSLSGAMADERLPVAPARLPAVLDAIGRALGAPAAAGAGRGPWTSKDGDSPNASPIPLDSAESAFVAALTRDLRAHAPRVVCVAGAAQPPEVRRWALALNRRLGAVGHTVRLVPAVRSDADPRASGDLGALTAAIDRGGIGALVILGANPAQTAPGEMEFARRLAAVPLTVHAGTQADETAALCHWHLPESHYLECWSDLRGFDGSAVIQQPLIEPMYDTRSPAEILRLLSADQTVSGYDLVRATWQGGSDFEAQWTQWLNQGVVGRTLPPPPAPPASAAASEGAVLPPASDRSSLTLLFRPDPHLADGRWANNGWLQELPRPFTSLVWDNALLISPALAARHQLANGDFVRLAAGARFLEAPVWLLPGQADGCAVAHLGGGRTRAGSVGTGHGFDAYPLRGRNHPWSRAGVTLTPVGRRMELASTQHHFSMEGRNPARHVSLAEIAALRPEPPAGSLYPPQARSGHAWGMSIDLSTCIGCSACVAACQAENNIPVVGREQVLRGREMHWIRVDRYFLEGAGSPRCLAQPVPCMHCENAPCELVCPVGATVHSSEGLNEMVYNRCVGTRYCSNNCPYKVRRFNFFDYRAAPDSVRHLQDNPNVTVRERGVMEKCSYCVQRITAGRIAADRTGRAIRDGEIRTACQQACPAEAIVFGDLADPDSAVARRKREPSDYALLGELNTRPRTTYLPRMINPA